MLGNMNETKSARWLRLKTKALSLSFLTGGHYLKQMTTNKIHIGNNNISTDSDHHQSPTAAHYQQASDFLRTFTKPPLETLQQSRDNLFVKEYNPRTKKAVTFNYLDYLGKVPPSPNENANNAAYSLQDETTEAFYYTDETNYNNYNSNNTNNQNSTTTTPYERQFNSWNRNQNRNQF
jgi:hypothetical protein